MHFETCIAVVKFIYANTSINVHFVFSSALDATIIGFLSHNWFCWGPMCLKSAVMYI